MSTASASPITIYRTGYANRMRNIELHVMENNADVGDGITSGLLEIEELDGAECAACAEEVGHIAGTFFPYAVALDEESQWLVCTECATDVLETSPIDEGPFEYFTKDAND